jgi:hypothetical protein
MSRQMILASQHGERQLQTPADDLQSFCYVAQWSAVLHDVTEVPPALERLRRDLLGCQPVDRAAMLPDREAVRLLLQTEENLGPFLDTCQPFLVEWGREMKDIYFTQKLDQVAAITDTDSLRAHFKAITWDGVLRTLRSVEKFVNNLE